MTVESIPLMFSVVWRHMLLLGVQWPGAATGHGDTAQGGRLWHGLAECCQVADPCHPPGRPPGAGCHCTAAGRVPLAHQGGCAPFFSEMGGGGGGGGILGRFICLSWVSDWLDLFSWVCAYVFFVCKWFLFVLFFCILLFVKRHKKVHTFFTTVMLLVTCLVCVFISVVHSAPKSCCYLLVLVDSDIFYGWCSNSVTCWTPGSVSFSLELIVLPPSVVDGCSRNPLYYYYYWWVGRLLPTEYYRPMVSLGFIYFAFATFLFPVTSVGISAWHCDFYFIFIFYMVFSAHCFGLICSITCCCFYMLLLFYVLCLQSYDDDKDDDRR